MNVKQAKNLFKKYTNNECSLEEIQLLDTFLDSYQDKNNTWPELKVGKEEAFKKYSWQRIEFQINKSQNKKRYPFSPYLRYIAVASVLLLVALTLFFNKEDSSQLAEPAIVNTIIKPGTDKATLTLGDGSQIALEKGTSFKTQSANSNGEEIIYSTGQGNTEEVTYNYLTIPRGGQFFIKLSDGTQVWLNSESQLKYPVSFVDGETRQVELIYGEAYFDVTPSSENKGSKFVVLNDAQEVEVLGTEFNIKAYKDDANIYTTLVEGKVVVDNGVLKQYLIPNEQSNLDIINNNISVSVVDNVNTEISWKNGIFSFKGKSLKDIMKVISRWYDVDVVFENKNLETLKFKGTLDKDQSIEEILSIMKSSTISNYDIKDKTIILK